MKVLVFCSTSKPLISSYLGINAVYRNSFDSLPSELIVIAHDNDRLSGDRGNLWGGGNYSNIDGFEYFDYSPNMLASRSSSRQIGH